MKIRLTVLFLLPVAFAFAQEPIISDSVQNVNTNFHFQLTTVTQHKLRMDAPYTGANSLTGRPENATTLTATLFWGLQFWKGAAFYLNPEIAGGSGISGAHGIAGFSNGEAFRVGNPAPTMYAGRAFFQQTIGLSEELESVGEGANDVYKVRAKKYLDIIIGKFSIADYFDKNQFSHDPRSQFLNWSLMSNGAWDYPANVRGYTWGTVVEYGSPGYSLRAAAVMVPVEANGNEMDRQLSKAYSTVVEFEKKVNGAGLAGTYRVLAFYTRTHMGNYNLAVSQQPLAPDITSTRAYGRTKFGYGFNFAQELSALVGVFGRASWNDGRNETWAFTEIDRSISLGLLFDGKRWKRDGEAIGLGTVINGLSSHHRQYLGAGGYGFILGDGQLNYGMEWGTEIFYRAHLFSEAFYLTPNAQFVMNPGYNKDRGPAFIIGIRAHVEF
jgi:high affinity Mn2+ porin